MTAHATSTDHALRLLAEILARYGSLDAFLAQVRRELEEPTVELPRISAPRPLAWSEPARWPITPPRSTTSGRHARRAT